MGIFKRTPQITISDDVLAEIGRRKTERERVIAENEVTPEKVRAAITDRDWARLEKLFRTNDHFIVNYADITDEERRGIEDLHDEITELIRNSDVTPELVSFISFYYERTWIGVEDVDALCADRIDEAGLEIRITFPNLKWGTPPRDIAEFISKSDLFTSKFGEKLVSHVISHIRIDNAADAEEFATALDPIIDLKGDWNLYGFLRRFEGLDDFQLIIDKSQFQKMLRNSQNGSVAYLLANGKYPNVDHSDFEIAVRAIGEENIHPFSGGTENSQTNVAKLILDKLPKVTKSDIDVIVEQLTLHPTNSQLNLILSKALDKLPSRNGSNDAIVSALIPLNRDGVTKVLIEKGIYSPDSESITRFFTEGHYGSVEALAVKGFIPSSEEFDRALSDERSDLIGMFIANGYVPSTVDQVRALPDYIMTALEERLSANGVKIPTVATNLIEAPGL
ncbi:MAG: hypothetical protein U0R17_02790 [Acidimicrobiia bacterium]